MNTLTPLQRAVIEQLGYDELDEECLSTLQEVTEHGADAAFGQFIYYSDTASFFDNHRTDILRLVADMADQLGENTCSLVRGFNCLNGDYDAEVDLVLMGLECDDDIYVKNALTWFALEETARTLTDS